MRERRLIVDRLQTRSFRNSPEIANVRFDCRSGRRRDYSARYVTALRSSLRLSLPVAVFGSAFTNSISRGYL